MKSFTRKFDGLENTIQEFRDVSSTRMLKFPNVKRSKPMAGGSVSLTCSPE